MNQDKWQETKGRIKESFDVVEETREEMEDGVGEREIIIFTGPLGKIKLEMTIRPVILDKKVIHSKRIGSQAATQYTYSPNEKTCKLKVCKWNEAADEWEEISTTDFIHG